MKAEEIFDQVGSYQNLTKKEAWFDSHSLVAYGFDRDRVVQSIKFCICIRYATKNDFIRGATN